MGLQINRNEKGLYSMKSTISDESYHPKKKFISEDEAKKILITNELYDFIEKIVKIDMEFPKRYKVNDTICNDEKPSFYDWQKDTNFDDSKLIAKFEETLKKYDIDLGFSEE